MLIWLEPSVVREYMWTEFDLWDLNVQCVDTEVEGIEPGVEENQNLEVDQANALDELQSFHTGLGQDDDSEYEEDDEEDEGDGNATFLD